MKGYGFLILFALWFSVLQAQTSQDRYFNELEGTVWSSGTESKASVTGARWIGLLMVETPISSIEDNTTLWSFTDEVLRIESYRAGTRERSLILECKYEHSKEKRLLTLLIDKQEILFQYVAISNGGFVSLTRSRRNRFR